MTREKIAKLPFKIEIPSLMDATDEENGCYNCRCFSRSTLSWPEGWCAKYSCLYPNTDLYSICNEWDNPELLEGGVK